MVNEFDWYTQQRNILKLYQIYNAEGDPAAEFPGLDTMLCQTTQRSNVLNFDIQFNAKKPIGGQAHFRLFIDKWVDNRWYPIVREDPVYFGTSSDDWESIIRSYSIDHGIKTAEYSSPPPLKFKITGRVWEGRSYSHELGRWGPVHSREFTVNFNPLEASEAKEYFPDNLMSFSNNC